LLFIHLLLLLLLLLLFLLLLILLLPLLLLILLPLLFLLLLLWCLFNIQSHYFFFFQSLHQLLLVTHHIIMLYLLRILIHIPFHHVSQPLLLKCHIIMSLVTTLQYKWVIWFLSAKFYTPSEHMIHVRTRLLTIWRTRVFLIWIGWLWLLD
jgi:hypothetical protein